MEYIVMDMKLDSALIRQERETRAWSQEHLAEVTGLALRTIQRIESTGSASYESASAIAAVFGLSVASLRGVAIEPAVPTRRAPQWVTWHHLITLLGAALLAAIFTPPHFRVAIPAAVTLWLSCELAIKTRRSPGAMAPPLS
jgi:transcriptional regulator with XRE-family HTH domain